MTERTVQKGFLKFLILIGLDWVDMVENKMNGDDFISGFLMKLWSLHQEIIFRWGTYTMFHYQRGIPTAQKEHTIPGYINWFVPRDDANCFEIIQFLEHELDHEREEGQWFGDCYFSFFQIFISFN